MAEICPWFCSEYKFLCDSFGHPSALVANHSATQGFILCTYALTFSNDHNRFVGISLELVLCTHRLQNHEMPPLHQNLSIIFSSVKCAMLSEASSSLAYNLESVFKAK